MPQKFLAPGPIPGTYVEVTPIENSNGANDAGKIPCLGADGRFKPNMLPVGIGADTVTIKASEVLSAGDYVNVYMLDGVVSCRKALAADLSRPANGFVLSSVATGENATVYGSGLNNVIPNTNFSVEDFGKEVCLSATLPGVCTTTCPTEPGNIVQPLGRIMNVDASFVTVEFVPKTIIIRG